MRKPHKGNRKERFKKGVKESRPRRHIRAASTELEGDEAEGNEEELENANEDTTMTAIRVLMAHLSPEDRLNLLAEQDF